MDYTITPIGFIHSKLKSREEAPRFYTEGAPDAYIEIYTQYSEALEGLTIGEDIVVMTWLHLAQRDVLKVHPRGDMNRPLRGVFLTRSPDRPNPLGLHRATVLEILPDRLHISAIEAIDGTPVVDIKPVVESMDH